MPKALITAIVSTYSAERFMRSCLEDLVAQTLFSEMEVLVIDSGSPQGESAICEEFVHRYPQIKLIRTEREPLYVAWNRAIPLASGRYLTNANTDDRHHPDFMATMVAALESHPEAALAYADQLISHTENESFAECESRGAKLRRWPDYTPEDLMLRCITGSQPVWRKAMHSALGVFDTGYRIAADYDMWLRFASQHPLLHVPKTLSVFFDSPNTISGANNRIQVNLETLAIQKIYVDYPQWRDIPKMRKRLAAEIFGRGYQHIEHDHNVQAAQPFIREAVKLDPTNLRFLKTYFIRCLAGFQSKSTE
jgi:glycosyltransferase involved in cell wall biosynthesis